MVRIVFNEDNFEVDMEGMEKFEALKRKLVIPYSHLDRVDDNAAEIVTGFRLMGTGVTRTDYDFGRFNTNEGMGFYVMKHKDKAFAIHLKDDDYSVLVLQLENNAEAIDELRKRMHS